ncbi:hypothetical protein HFN89_01795 [Rhizobium laguerreae]|nr:hypothetical protein [Rhizobium laguerreae]
MIILFVGTGWAAWHFTNPDELSLTTPLADRKNVVSADVVTEQSCKDGLVAIAEALFDRETLTGDEVRRLAAPAVGQKEAAVAEAPHLPVKVLPITLLPRNTVPSHSNGGRARPRPALA